MTVSAESLEPMYETRSTLGATGEVADLAAALGWLGDNLGEGGGRGLAGACDGLEPSWGTVFAVCESENSEVWDLVEFVYRFSKNNHIILKILHIYNIAYFSYIFNTVNDTADDQL